MAKKSLIIGDKVYIAEYENTSLKDHIYGHIKLFTWKVNEVMERSNGDIYINYYSNFTLINESMLSSSYEEALCKLKDCPIPKHVLEDLEGK